MYLKINAGTSSLAKMLQLKNDMDFNGEKILYNSEIIQN